MPRPGANILSMVSIVEKATPGTSVTTAVLVISMLWLIASLYNGLDYSSIDGMFRGTYLKGWTDLHQLHASLFLPEHGCGEGEARLCWKSDTIG